MVLSFDSSIMYSHCLQNLLCNHKLFSVASACVASKRDNAGGIAASVIVVLLLIATLIGLLVYYLRTRQRAKTVTVQLPSFSSGSAGINNQAYEPGSTVS